MVWFYPYTFIAGFLLLVDDIPSSIKSIVVSQRPSILRCPVLNIRMMTIEDYLSVYKLWALTLGMGLNNVDDSEKGIARMLKRNPTLSFVAEDDNQIIGVIIAGEDGRRGYLYHTAVHQDYRHKNIGKNLVKSVLDEMKELEITKVGLFIFQNNHIGNGFWENMGFKVREDLYYRDLALTELQRIDT